MRILCEALLHCISKLLLWETVSPYLLAFSFLFFGSFAQFLEVYNFFSNDVVFLCLGTAS